MIVKLMFDLYKTLLSDKLSKRFLSFVCLGLSFAISIILSASGIMDGYQKIFSSIIYSIEGQYQIVSSKGFFNSKSLSLYQIKQPQFNLVSLVEIKGMALFDKNATGVLIRGIDKSYKFISDIKININECAIGKELSLKYNLKKGDFISLSFLAEENGLKNPVIIELKIAKIFKTGFFEQDLRSIIVSRLFLESKIQLHGLVNKILIQKKENIHGTDFQNAIFKLDNSIGIDYSIVSSLSKFDYLIKAVKAEKVMIMLALQLIIIISSFNLYAFINYLKEKKQQNFFLLKALGASKKIFIFFFSSLIFFIWSSSCLLSLVFIKYYQYALLNFKFLKLPGDIYYISRLLISLDVSDYLIVFSISLFWIILLVGFSFRKFSTVSIGQGLRGELN